jgi:hypothetical protein
MDHGRKTYAVFIADILEEVTLNEIICYLNTKVTVFDLTLKKKKGSKKSKNAIVIVYSFKDFNLLMNQSFNIKGHQSEVRQYLGADERKNLNDDRKQRRVYFEM